MSECVSVLILLITVPLESISFIMFLDSVIKAREKRFPLEAAEKTKNFIYLCISGVVSLGVLVLMAVYINSEVFPIFLSFTLIVLVLLFFRGFVNELESYNRR